MNGTVSEHLKAISRRMDGVVAVLGDYMLDEYIFGSVNRISPESPVPVVEFAGDSSSLGGAGNVVTNIRALGGQPVPFGLVGNDDAGRRVLAALAADCAGGAGHMVVDDSRPTTVKRRIVAHHQQLLRIDYESRAAVAAELHGRLLDNLRGAIGGCQAMVVSDYNKGVVTRAFFDRALRVALDAGVPVVLDPKAFDLAGLGPVTVITPNEKEAERYSGCRVNGDAGAENAGQRLLEQTGACNILITRGEHGMSLFTAGTAPFHMPTQAREVYDVTGAGDTVVAVLALAMAAGALIPDAAQLANLAAGVVVGKSGTATVSRQELESALSGVWPHIHRGKRHMHTAG